MSLKYIILIFVVAAVFGATLLTFVLKDKKRPAIIVLLHGLFALAATGLLMFYTSEDYGDLHERPDTAALFFFIAIAGGVYMFIRDKIMKVGIPKWFPFLHAGAAVTGLILLILFAFHIW